MLLFQIDHVKSGIFQFFHNPEKAGFPAPLRCPEHFCSYQRLRLSKCAPPTIGLPNDLLHLLRLSHRPNDGELDHK